MTQQERVEKLIEEIRDKLSSGWKIEAISVNRFTLNDKPNMYIELEIVEE